MRTLDSINRELMTEPQCNQTSYMRWEQGQAGNEEFRKIVQAHRNGVRKAKFK